MSSALPSSSKVCDTLPPARLVFESDARMSSPTPPVIFTPPILETATTDAGFDSDKEKSAHDDNRKVLMPSGSQPSRKLCIRHQRMADEGTNLKLQQALDALPLQERESVNALWSNFSSSSHPRRALILQGLLTMCCFSQLSLLTEHLSHLLRIDPFTIIPREVSLKILGYLDAQSLCRAAQVSRQWKSLADDDILWRGICEQHIGQTCKKCGWGLPVLEKRRTARITSPSPQPLPHSPPMSAKRSLEPDSDIVERPLKRPCTSVEPSRPASPSNPLLAPNDEPALSAVTRPWKDVYCERLTIERNWRRGRCTVRTLKGHTDGVMCLQFSETLSHPAFPVLITGSYDRTARVWNLETGKEVRCLSGHTRAVRALQFDEAKLVTGSMDHTMRVWNWRTGKCLKILEGHTEGVVSLNFDSNVLASGSVDRTVKVWNFRTGECFTLRGHCDWVNAVQLWDSNAAGGCSSSAPAPEPDHVDGAPCIDPGKMLFSASDDGMIKLWDLSERTCVRTFKGHVGQVQSLKLLLVDESRNERDADDSESEGEARQGPRPLTLSGIAVEPVPGRPGSSSNVLSPPNGRNPYAYPMDPNNQPIPAAYIHPISDDENRNQRGKERVPPSVERTGAGQRLKPVLISGSLDNTIKVWDIATGKAVKTLFGHIEGVWAVASDSLRLVSGSHDRTIKVWVREEGRCMATLVGHRGAVTCLALGEDKIVSGSDDGDIRVWSFSE